MRALILLSLLVIAAGRDDDDYIYDNDGMALDDQLYGGDYYQQQRERRAEYKAHKRYQSMMRRYRPGKTGRRFRMSRYRLARLYRKHPELDPHYDD